MSVASCRAGFGGPNWTRNGVGGVGVTVPRGYLKGPGKFRYLRVCLLALQVLVALHCRVACTQMVLKALCPSTVCDADPRFLVFC